jgi:hypothetical protein
MPSSRFAYAVGVVELGVGVVFLAFGVLGVVAGVFPRRPSEAAAIVAIAGIALLPIGASFMLGGTAARRGWRGWYAYACLPILTALAIAVASQRL